ncbi:MAG: dethiobiotin synthase [Acidobacteriota bacterium]
MHGCFVTGTDTGVGKTVLSAMLARSRGWGYWKGRCRQVPKAIATRSPSWPAATFGIAACACRSRCPAFAARLAGTCFEVRDLIAMSPIQGKWVVEGAGGVLVPLNDYETMLDLMTALDLPVIVAARSTLGTINHTLMTLEIVRTRGLVVEKVVMIGDRHEENRAAVAAFGTFWSTRSPGWSFN